jgi:Ino eighty subunit 1
MSAVAAPLSSAPPSSPGGSTIEDPDLADSDEDQSRILDPSSPNPLSSPTFRHDADPNNVEKPKRKPKMLRKGKGGPPRGSFAWIHEGPEDANTEEDEGDSVITEAYNKRPGWKQKKSGSPGTRQSTAATTVGTRRKGDGTIGSVYSGNKIRHLKKDDGVPLWRSDIQYEFLRLVFEDRSPHFTRLSDGQEGCNFADIYIDAMARSSKTSKVLKDKLISDRTAAQNMAMICLLVNVGRMNTTLNFFPEMRAQLRTYHSIPSLQAHRDQNAYKQLQDAPRLKSILKGASEDTDEPRTIEAIKAHSIPRTNPVNLIFVLSQYAPKISELHFFPPRDFFDLVMKPTISSKSRAQAFLWLMWWYLQSNFSEEAALNNPFGSGMRAPKDTMSIKVPELEELTEEQGAAENIDPPDEITFGEEKQLERKRILENDEPDSKVLKRVKKSAIGDDLLSDYEPRASLPRASSPAMRDSLGFAVLNPAHNADPATSRLGGQADSLEDDWEPVNPHPGRGRYKRVKKDRDSVPGPPPTTSSSGRVLMKTSKAQNQVLHDPGTPDSMQAQPPGAAHPILQQFSHGAEGTTRNEPAAPTTTTTTTTTGHRRPRPLTQHQLAVEANRRQLTEALLAMKKKEIFAELREKRERSNFVLRAAQRIQNLPMGYDSEDEGTSWGMGGLGPNPDDGEEDDFGEEAEMWMSVVGKVKRRLERWSGEEAVAIAARREVVRRRGGEGRWEDGEGEDVDVDMDLDEVDMGGDDGVRRDRGAAPSRGGPSLDDIDKSLLAERSDEDMDDGALSEESEETPGWGPD